MSDSKGTSDLNKSVKRNLPSWMSSRAESPNPNDEHEDEIHEIEKPKQGKRNAASTKSSKLSAPSSSGGSNFSQLLDGVVFVFSGFVNPDRATLRSQALEMGGEYRPDWSSDCTLLICAFSNTPKFRQVEADCGTIVSKEWISECYTNKKLVDIDRYLMHAGKPWRRSSVPHDIIHDQQHSPHRKSQDKVEKQSDTKISGCTISKQSDTKISDYSISKNGISKAAKEQFSPSKVKHWVVDDLNKTISWLESQEEKPDPCVIKDIAAEGILTCIQDVVDTLEQLEDVRQVTEQWGFIPRLVEELAKLDSLKGSSNSSSKKELHKQAIAGKQVYEVELKNLLQHDPTGKNKKAKTDENDKAGKGKAKDDCCDSTAYDSDETIEMTEDEIDLAYKTITSKC